MRLFPVILALLHLLFHLELNGQNLKYKKEVYKWPAEEPRVINTNPAFSKEDVVIVDEKVDMYIQEGKERLNYNNVFFHHYIRYRFLSEKGVQNHHVIDVPFSHYFQGDYRSVSVQKRGSIHRPKGDYNCIDYFSARIIKPDGRIVPAIFRDTIQIEGFDINMINRKVYSFHFIIENIEAGDDLEVQTGYREVYTMDTFFFHGPFAKQKTTYNVNYNSKFYKYYFLEHNGAKGTVTPIKSGNYNEQISWSYTDLPGNMDESGAHPYKELPFVTFYQHDLNYGVWNEGMTAIQKYLPFTWEYVNLRFIAHEDQDPRDKLSRNDKTTIAVRDFVSMVSVPVENKSTVDKMTNLHNEIALNFDYHRDDLFIMGTDFRMPRIPEFLDKKTLRQISRYDLYYKVLDRLQMEYYITFLLDKRINAINFDKYEGIRSSDLSFVLIDGKTPHYFIPKYHRYGFFANELPFYYEDTKCILIPQKVPYAEKSKIVKTIKFANVVTPYSSIVENSRNTNVLVSASLDALHAQFKATVKLSGQFSTMTRGIYLHEFSDTTASMVYGEKVYDKIPGVTGFESIVNSVDSLYPFKSEITSLYNSNQVIRKANEKQYAVNMKGWFNHIADTLLSSHNRTLAWFPDFVHQDRYKYFVKFNTAVNLIRFPDPVEIQNEHCVYKFNISLVQEDVILIESAFVMKSEMIPPGETVQLESIFEAMKKIDRELLLVEQRTENNK